MFNDINKELNNLLIENDEPIIKEESHNKKEIKIRKKKPELVRYTPPAARTASLNQQLITIKEIPDPKTVIQVTLDENNNDNNVNILYDLFNFFLSNFNYFINLKKFTNNNNNNDNFKNNESENDKINDESTMLRIEEVNKLTSTNEWSIWYYKCNRNKTWKENLKFFTHVKSVQDLER